MPTKKKRCVDFGSGASVVVRESTVHVGEFIVSIPGIEEKGVRYKERVISKVIYFSSKERFLSCTL